MTRAPPTLPRSASGLRRRLPWAAAGRLLASAALAAGWYMARTPATPRFAVPAGWPKPRYTFASNPITPAGFALGRRLFYDPLLSRDGSVSCGSCHQPFAAFAQVGHRVSHGVGGANGRRNSPGLFNLAWAPELMWDGAVHSLEVQPVAPLSNPIEMDSSLALAVTRLRASASYPAAFERAFGSAGIDSQRLLRALTQFTASLVSANAKYDRVMRGEASFTASEEAGLHVFRAQCAGCHAEPLFTDFSYRNNGLDATPPDAGRGAISGQAADQGRFRVPSLRNVAYTAPYMHDGRFATLREVVDHYADGISASRTLDPRLKNGLPLGAREREDLLAFLATLSDPGFVRDPRFAEVHQ